MLSRSAENRTGPVLHAAFTYCARPLPTVSLPRLVQLGRPSVASQADRVYKNLLASPETRLPLKAYIHSVPSSFS
jgi:hypothetical protein